MRRLCVLLLCLLMMVGVAAPAFAEGDIRTVCTPSAYVRKPGQEVTITVTLENAPDLKNGYYAMSFDNDVFELVSCKWLLPDPAAGSTVAPLPLIGFDYNYEDGTAVFAYENAENVNGDTFVFTLSVKQDAPLGDTQVGITSKFLAGGTQYETTDVDTTITIAEDIDAFSVSGTITSFNSETDDITIQLFTENGKYAAMPVIVNGNTAQYSFGDMAPGTYTLRVTKKDHAVSEFTVVVENEDVVLDATLYLYGDADGDGKVSTKDIIMLRKYIAARDPLTGESTVEVCSGADANGDGSISTKDLILLRKYIAAKDPITGESDVILGPNG